MLYAGLATAAANEPGIVCVYPGLELAGGNPPINVFGAAGCGYPCTAGLAMGAGKAALNELVAGADCCITGDAEKELLPDVDAV